MFKNNIYSALLLGLMLALVMTAGASTWQYCNVFNVVSPAGTPGGPAYGTELPSIYTSDFSSVTSFTPVSTWRRGAFQLDPVTGDEVPVRLSHDNVVFRMDLLSGVTGMEVFGVRLTIWGSPDFDPNFDLAPLWPTDAEAHWGTPGGLLEADTLTGIQFYIEKGFSAGSDVDVFDRVDIMALPERIAEDPITIPKDLGSVVTETFTPSQTWTNLGGAGAPRPGWELWEAEIYFIDPISVPYEATFNSAAYGLPFYRVWVVMQVTGCHDCCSYDYPGGIEGISNIDSFYVQIEERNDLIVRRNRGGWFSDVDMTLARPDVAWDKPYPDPADASRWARSEMIKGWDEITPFISDIYPRNEVSTAGPFTDILCDEENDSVFTADSTQPISVVAQDKGTCVEFADMRIEYVNPGIPTNFPRRIDEIEWRHVLEFPYDDQNAGHGTTWEARIRHTQRNPGEVVDWTSGWSGWDDTWTTIGANVICEPEVGCGANRFWADYGSDLSNVPHDAIMVATNRLWFIDGAHVKVTFRVWSRTDHNPFALSTPGRMNQEVWTFIVDLSGPTATLTCPSAENQDQYTREFSGNVRTDGIKGENVHQRWLADSLPTLHITLDDRYRTVHDTENHGINYVGGVGGAGINWRDFIFSFDVYNCGEVEPRANLAITQNHLGRGVWVDEVDSGHTAYMIIDFEQLYDEGFFAGILPFLSGDVIYVKTTRLFDDPDYGQGSQRNPWVDGVPPAIDPVDITPGLTASYGGGDGPDGNYGTFNRRHLDGIWWGFNHTIFDPDLFAAGVAGYANWKEDTLGILRIDLEGPTAPVEFLYPPEEWVTSDSMQVITLDIYDQIGCGVGIDDNWDTDPNADPFSIYHHISGIYSGSLDGSKRICMNIKVRGVDGNWHPYYHTGVGTIPDGRNFCVGATGAHAANGLNVVKMRSGAAPGTYHWGTRVTYDPQRQSPGSEAHFRAGDKVSVTVYAWDNAVTDCQSENSTGGPGVGWADPTDPWIGTFPLLCSDGSTAFTVEYEVPSRNCGYDRLDPLWYTRVVNNIARWSFYVDLDPPVFVDADLTDICGGNLFFYFRDVNDVADIVHSHPWIAKIGNSQGIDVEGCDFVLTVTDTKTPGGPYTSELIFENLIFNVPQMLNHNFPGLPSRNGDYYYAVLRQDPFDNTLAILELYGDGTYGTCNFLRPGDEVSWELYAGDSPSTPWYPASIDALGHVWRHSEDPWGTTASRLAAKHYTTTGTAGGDATNLDSFTPQPYLFLANRNDFYNPNWALIQEGNFEIFSETWLHSVKWFNTSAYAAYNTIGTDYNYPPDLMGQFDTLMAAWKGLYDNWGDPVIPVPYDTWGDSTDMSSMTSTDEYLQHYAKDLNFLVAEIFTCTDSVIYRRLAGSDPDEDTLIGRVPHIVLELTDADGATVWTIDEWFDVDAVVSFTRYIPDYSACTYWGRFHFGPIDQTEQWLETVRRIDTLEVDPLVTDTVYGYLDGDKLDVKFTFNVREPNYFGVDEYYTKLTYNWSYEIDMKPPTAVFRNPSGTTGYEEVNCHLVHDENNKIRLRLENIYDDAVGCAPGISVAPGWSSIWPIAAVEPGSDWVRYHWGTYYDEAANLIYNPGSEPYYNFTRDGYEIANCARETYVARAMDMGTTIEIYHGLDRSGARPVPVMTALDTDTILIADSVYAEAVLQDRLGNTAFIQSRKMGVDNTPPSVKGFALATMDLEVVGTDTLGDPIYGSVVLDNWDPELFKLPWAVPDQDSIVGIYNFADVCTVVVRLWFNDNMDMRDADHLYGHIVRFQPEGWTHWFPVLPIETVAGGVGGLRFPLAQNYVDYRDVDVTYTRPAPGLEETPYVPGSAESYDDGWNSDREWIGYFVIAGSGAMDGIGKLRVQGYDDNAGNYMIPVEYPLRIVTRDVDVMVIEWPRIDEFDTEPVYPWSGVRSDVDRLSGWSTSEGHLEDYSRCSFTVDPRMKEVTGYWDNQLAETDSVVFKMWWSDEPFPAGTTLTTGYTYHWVEDDMYSDNIWIDGENTWVMIPTTDIDILRQYYNSLGGAPILYSNNEKYLHIVMEAYSRFRGDDPFLTTSKVNVLIDNKRVAPAMTILGGGQVVHGDNTILPFGTTTLKLCWGGDDIHQIDHMAVYLYSLIDGSKYALLPEGSVYEPVPEYAPVLAAPPLYYNPTLDVICLEYSTPDGLPPGMWTVSWKAYSTVHNVIEYDDGITEYWSYFHSDCEFDFFDSDTLTVLRPTFVARGDNLIDALNSVSANFPTVANSDDIFPWWGSDMESYWPDWPTWGWIEADAIGAIDSLPDFFRVEDFQPLVQITTYNNPIPGISDPFLRAYTETGGYIGDSLYVLLESLPTDGDIRWVDLNIADYWGGPISGSNPELNVRLFPDTDIYTVGDRSFWAFKWTVDDMDNRYDGLVRLTATASIWSSVSSSYHEWDHVGFVLLDTKKPTYEVSMLREEDSSVPFRAVNPVDYPDEEFIWVVNDQNFKLFFHWDNTIFDPAAPGDPLSYFNYSDYIQTRHWDYMRLCIDGMPNHGSFDDPNDHFESRLWDDHRETYDIYNQFWRQPDYMNTAFSPSSYDDAGMIYTLPVQLEYFGDNVYSYVWDVAGAPEGLPAQGIAYLLVKGRDAAGNILMFEDARNSEAIGKLVLVDIESPIVDADKIVATGENFTAFTEAFDDNFFGQNYTDLGGNGYVYVIVTDGDGAMLGDTLWVSPTGAISTRPWVGASPDPGDVVTVTAYDLAGNSTSVDITVVPEEHCCAFDLCPDWNLIGISVMPDPPMTIGDVFGGMTVYRMVDGDYVAVPPTDLLVPGEGLAVYPSAAATIEICGVPVESFTVDVTPGWNLIGAPWGGVDFTTPHTTPPSAIDPTETRIYNCGVDYELTNSLHSCRGHLVMAFMDAVLEVPGVGGRKVVYTIKDATIEPMLTGRIVAGGRTLTFGAANGATAEFDRGIDRFSIPAYPGEGNLTFINGLDKDYRAVENTIEWDVISEASFDATIELENTDWTISWNGVTVDNGASINVVPGKHKLVATRVAVPEAFALNQNIPNPFNATTTISYELPENTEVRLEVFTMLGQKVTTLVSGEEEAGYKSVVWDGTDSEGKLVPTGIYFYRLEAGSFKATNKMALMK